MDLHTYISDLERRRALANALDTNEGYLWQLAKGWRGRRPSPAFAQRIEEATERLGPEKVTKESLIFGPAPAQAGEADRAA